MKNTASLAGLLLVTATVFAQKNMLKGHIGAMVANTDVYSMGIGYERMVTGRWSAQLMFNNYGWSQGRLDGETETNSNSVLEARRYFGEKSGEIPNTALFVGCFAEIFRRHVLPGGETATPPLPITGNRHGFGTGLVLGAHLPVFKKLTLEFFAGPKFRYVKSVDYIGTATSYESYNAHSYPKLTPRIGCNIGYRF